MRERRWNRRSAFPRSRSPTRTEPRRARRPAVPSPRRIAPPARRRSDASETAPIRPPAARRRALPALAGAARRRDPRWIERVPRPPSPRGQRRAHDPPRLLEAAAASLRTVRLGDTARADGARVRLRRPLPRAEPCGPARAARGRLRRGHPPLRRRADVRPRPRRDELGRFALGPARPARPSRPSSESRRRPRPARSRSCRRRCSSFLRPGGATAIRGRAPPASCSTVRASSAPRPPGRAWSAAAGAPELITSTSSCSTTPRRERSSRRSFAAISNRHGRGLIRAWESPARRRRRSTTSPSSRCAGTRSRRGRPAGRGRRSGSARSAGRCIASSVTCERIPNACEAGARWSESICSRPETIAALLLGDALAADPSSPLLFSSSRAEHVTAAARATGTEVADDALAAFRRLVAGELPGPEHRDDPRRPVGRRSALGGRGGGRRRSRRNRDGARAGRRGLRRAPDRERRRAVRRSGSSARRRRRVGSGTPRPNLPDHTTRDRRHVGDLGRPVCPVRPRRLRPAPLDHRRRLARRLRRARAVLRPGVRVVRLRSSGLRRGRDRRPTAGDRAGPPQRRGEDLDARALVAADALRPLLCRAAPAHAAPAAAHLRHLHGNRATARRRGRRPTLLPHADRAGAPGARAALRDRLRRAREHAAPARLTRRRRQRTRQPFGSPRPVVHGACRRGCRERPLHDAAAADDLRLRARRRRRVRAATALVLTRVPARRRASERDRLAHPPRPPRRAAPERRALVHVPRALLTAWRMARAGGDPARAHGNRARFPARRTARAIGRRSDGTCRTWRGRRFRRHASSSRSAASACSPAAGASRASPSTTATTGTPSTTTASMSPRRDSRVTLAEERDALGLPKLKIDIRFSDADVDGVVRAHQRWDEHLQRHGAGRLEYLTPDVAESVRGWLGGGFHQSGTTRMSARSEDGVVDKNLAVHGLPTLHVISSSTFPTSSQANSTFMIIPFALRLVDHLKRSL